jgi:hypothetical protein
MRSFLVVIFAGCFSIIISSISVSIDTFTRGKLDYLPIQARNQSIIQISNVPSQRNDVLCPGLLSAAHYVVNTSEILRPLKVVLLQQMGSWKDGESQAVFNDVFESNSRIAVHHGYISKSLTNKTRSDKVENDDRVLHPAFRKIKAVQEACEADHPDLVWFLDGDVVITNPFVRIEMLWYFYQSKYPQLDMLFSSDHNGLNSGVFVVNCSSETAMKTLEYWDMYAPEVNAWKGINKGRYEQNAIHWLIQSHWWKRKHPLHKRKFELMADVPLHAKKQFGATLLRRTRVIVVNDVCELSSFPAEFQCNSTNSSLYTSVQGYKWWEEGQFILHTAGARNPFKRLPYLKNILQKLHKFNVELGLPESLSLREAARDYLEKFELWKSTDPASTLDMMECRKNNANAFKKEMQQKKQLRQQTRKWRRMTRVESSNANL